MEKLASKLAGIKTVAIAGHVRPDGDCIGSCMGLYLYLKENEPDIKCDVYLETAKEGFSYIKNLEEAKQEYDSQAEYDLLILLDVSSPDRIGVAGEALKTAKKTICLDHHISNHGFADENLIEPEMSSASELLFHLLEEEKNHKRCGRGNLYRNCKRYRCVQIFLYFTGNHAGCGKADGKRN